MQAARSLFRRRTAMGLPLIKMAEDGNVPRCINDSASMIADHTVFPRFVMERSEAAINMWFWSRHDSSVPNDVKSGSNSVNPQNWVSGQFFFTSLLRCADHMIL